jgi:hypothetical protein
MSDLLIKGAQKALDVLKFIGDQKHALFKEVIDPLYIAATRCRFSPLVD